MQLTVRDVAAALTVSENEVHRLVSQRGLPATRVNGQVRFNRAELVEWATVHKMPLSPAVFQNGNANGHVRLDRALQAGTIVYSLPGTDKEAVLRAVIGALPLPAGFDPDFLLRLFLGRESLGSTAMGNGIAIPHPRYPVVLPVDQPSITLCFLKQPIPYGSPDARPVNAIFAVISPTVGLHLQLLARLAVALREPAFLTAIERKSPADEILEQARRVEDALHSDRRNGSTEAR